MITVFNRRELLVTTDIEKYANVKEDLAAAGIDFKLSSKGNTFKHAVARTHTGLQGGKKAVNGGMIYTVYVQEKEYNKAIAVINKKDSF